MRNAFDNIPFLATTFKQMVNDLPRDRAASKPLYKLDLLRLPRGPRLSEIEQARHLEIEHLKSFLV